jgi:hypothetical protein
MFIFIPCKNLISPVHTVYKLIIDLQLPMQSVPITTKVVSSNPVHGEEYSMQQYVIKFNSDLRQVSFSAGTPVSSTNKTE